MVAELEHLAQVRKVLSLVVSANVRVPAIDWDEKHTRAVKPVERLADVGRFASRNEHPAYPGRAAAMGTGD
jgi:hypothetical protein